MREEKRKLIKFSNYSLCVTLPKWVIDYFNWEKGDLVNLEIDSDSAKIIISADKNKTKLSAKKSDKLRW